MTHCPMNRPLNPSLIRRPRRAAAIALGTLLCAITAGPAPAQRNTAAGDELAAERLLREAERHLQSGNVDDALAELRALVEKLPRSKRAPEALLRSARILDQGQRTNEAEEMLGRLGERYPDSGEAADGAVLAATFKRRSATTQAELQAVRTEVRRIPNLFGAESYPFLPARTEARLLAALLSDRLGEPDAAAAEYIAALEDEPASPLTHRARLGLGHQLLLRGDWAAAADELQRVVEGSGLEGKGDPALVAEARDRLAFIHRLILRPSTGLSPWQRARPLDLPGVGLKRPTSIAINVRGEITVVDAGQEATLHLASDGRAAARTAGRNQRRAFYDLNGDAWIASQLGVDQQGAAQLRVFTPQSKPKPLDKVVAAERGTFGQWYIADDENPGVFSFDPNGSPLQHIAANSLGSVVDLAHDARGRIYALDKKGKAVVRLAEGTTDGRFTVAAKAPGALAIDAVGRMYVLDDSTREILLYDEQGRAAGKVGPLLPGGLELRDPRDLAVDLAGRLYVADAKAAAIIVLE